MNRILGDTGLIRRGVMDNEALTPQEVADILKITKNTIYELIKRGELNAYRVGKKVRIDLADVEDYKNKTKKQKTGTAAASTVDSGMLRRPSQSFADLPRTNGFVICGQDIMLDILSRYLQIHLEGLPILRSYVGSYDGLYSLYQGNVHMTAAHLWDGDTNQYNVPYVRRMVPGIPTVVIHLACRMQGFYVPKGNPKGITGWEDFKKKDITLINREKGSGTRVLLDEHLRKLGILASSIAGYDRESTSHLAIASTVARGGADVGIGNEKSGLQVNGIDFIPLQKERYDLVIKKENINKPPFQAVLEILNSHAFKMELEGIGGYDLSQMGKIIAEI